MNTFSIPCARAAGAASPSRAGAADESTESAPVTRLPVAIIGAGPIGLVAAAHLVSKGETPLVFESGESVAASVRGWSHVRLFSPWRYLVDPVAASMLAGSGWVMPEPDLLPTGGDLVREFLEPLASLPEIWPHIRLGARVVAVTRLGLDKAKTRGREDAPFELLVHDRDGTESRVLARAVIDASGTYRTANPLGAGGLPAAGELAHAERIFYGIPDVLGTHRTRYAGRTVLVVGSGHSAFNALLDLAELAGKEPRTTVLWAVRREGTEQMYGGGAEDALPARGWLGARLQQLVEAGVVRLITGFRISALRSGSTGIMVEGECGVLGPVDEIIATTGFRPDLSLTRELRLQLDPALESPTALAPLIDPNVHSCGTVYPHGAAELAHPERDFYTVGMKSYGRAPTFLLLTGYEQVRSVSCAIVGDMEGARAVELKLPETGVCSTDLGGASCCGSAEEAVPALHTLGARPVRVELPTVIGSGSA